MNHPALDLVARGLHLTLIPFGEKLHGYNGWESTPRPDHDGVVGWLTARTNFGVLTGAPSGAFVLDVDPKGGAMDTMKALVAEHGPMPPTLVVATPSGGWHYFYEMPGFEVRNSQSKIGAGVDIRGTGGYVVAAGSWTRAIEGKQAEGWYQVVNDAPITQAPVWLREWLWAEHEKRTRGAQQGTKAAVEASYDPARAGDYAVYEQRAVEGELQRLADLPRPWHEGAGWDITTFEVACSLLEIANAGWSSLTAEEVETLLLEHAPSDGAWGDEQIIAKLDSARRRIGTNARPAPALRPKVDLLAGAMASSGLAPVSSTAPAAPGEGGRVVVAGREPLDVGNPAKVVEWLRENLGRGALSGIFSRGQDVIFTPRIGHDGYIEPRLGEPEASASITVLDHHGLAARVQGRFAPFRMSEVADADGTKKRIAKPELFPSAAAMHAIKAPDDMTSLRQLRGVVHTPTFRPDGSLISSPGYDVETGLLFLPTGGQPTAAIPETPTEQDVATARAWLDYMLQDFAFVSTDDRTNYLGLMLTPLLRSMVPAPYKLGVIEAHQPGSGKTFLARALMSIHSGVMHSEMPSEEAELIKTVTSILDTDTGAVVVFDNVSGIVRSSALAGLLTSPTFQGRRLGTGKLVEAVNDRLWVLTGNNAVLGGDLPRRTLRVRIDPGVPNPENRTRFAIADFESWVRQNRGTLLWSLIVLVRNWVAGGGLLPDEIRADSYGRWAAIVGSILEAAGVPGTFDDPTRAAEDVDPDTEEWTQFFAAIYRVHGSSPWTAKFLMSQVAPPVEGLTATAVHPLPYDLLPSSLLSGKQIAIPTALVRALGMFLKMREGRWFGDYSVKRRPVNSSENSAQWSIVKHGDSA